jgi:DNA helicase-2/ATP-dependent DNA helicase PcrA
VHPGVTGNEIPAPSGLVILGPPGTGKTRHLVEAVHAEVCRGVAPDRIAFLTFTRAAREEAVERVRVALGAGTDAIPWFRTIHATAYRLLGLKRQQVMTDSGWDEFGRRYGYKFTRGAVSIEDPLAELPRHTDGDLLRHAHQWGRNRMQDVERIMARCPIPVSAVQFPLFVRRLLEFKVERGLLDFTDMLGRVLDENLRPHVDVLFVDEAQDLSPLQVSVVEHWMRSCASAYVAGDDDQAIYAFQGADPSWLRRLAERWRVEVLRQSHRVPASVLALAEKVIGRNQDRIEKGYRPTAHKGIVERIGGDELFGALNSDVDTLILARNREFLKAVARGLFERRVPYVVEGPGGISPLSEPNIVRATRTSTAIFCGQPVDARDLEMLLKFIPSRGCDLLPHGVKQRVKELEGVVSLEMMRVDLRLERLLDRIRSRDPIAPLIKLPANERAYLRDLLVRHGDFPNPKIRLTTIHGAKGREADTVVVIPDMSRATYEEYTDYSRGGFEAENRAAYVAVTRAKRRLILVSPRSRRHYDFPASGESRVADA